MIDKVCASCWDEMYFKGKDMGLVVRHLGDSGQITYSVFVAFIRSEGDSLLWQSLRVYLLMIAVKMGEGAHSLFMGDAE